MFLLKLCRQQAAGEVKEPTIQFQPEMPAAGFHVQLNGPGCRIAMIEGVRVSRTHGPHAETEHLISVYSCMNKKKTGKPASPLQ